MTEDASNRVSPTPEQPAQTPPEPGEAVPPGSGGVPLSENEAGKGEETPGDASSDASAELSTPVPPAEDWVAEASDGLPRTDSEPPAVPPHLERAYRRASRRMVITASVVAVLVLGSAAFIGSKAISRRFEGARKLDRAKQLVESADKTILDLDEVVRAEASPELATKADGVAARIPAARDWLKEAVSLIDQAYDDVTEDEQRKSALLRDAADARLAMLRPAETILAANAKAGRALEPSQEGWKLVLDAEKLSDSAVSEYNKLTKEGVTAASQLSGQSEKLLRDARRYLSEAATAFPEAGFERYLVFVDGKLGLLAISKQSNAAWLAGKLADANALIKSYNTEEQRVIGLARTLPRTPGLAIAEAYENLVSKETEEYYSAREAATKADAALDTF